MEQLLTLVSHRGVPAAGAWSKVRRQSEMADVPMVESSNSAESGQDTEIIQAARAVSEAMEVVLSSARATHHAGLSHVVRLLPNSLGCDSSNFARAHTRTNVYT